MKDIDYGAAIAHCFATLGHAQGTRGCIAFAKGAEWFRDQQPVVCPGELDDDSPLWLINAQIDGLLEGLGASEDHENVLTFLRETGLPESTVRRMHLALCHGDAKVAALTEVATLRAAITAVVREPHDATVGIVNLHIIDGGKEKLAAAHARENGITA